MGYTKRHNTLKGTALKAVLLSGVCASSLAITAPAYAQDGDVEEFVVTGTSIRGTELVGSAVQTIDSKAIAESGKTTIGDILRELPINLAGGVGIGDNVATGQDAGPNSANLSGGQGVNLRGLGALSTLVLINGRRAPASGQFGDFVDVSNIPAAAIERVEILQDGASAIYGSDAVGGVVNFIMKRQMDNPVSSVKIGTTTQGGGQEIQGSHVQPLNWASGNAIFSVEYAHKDAVKYTDRDPYSNGTDYSGLGGVDWESYTARIGPQTNIYAGGGAASTASVYGYVPNGASSPLDWSELVVDPTGVGSTHNPFEAVDVLPETERFSVFASVDQDLTDQLSFFGDARYTKRETLYSNGYEQVYKVMTPSSPFYPTGAVPAGAVDGSGNIGFGYLFDDRANELDINVDSFSATGGLRFDIFSDWVLEGAITYASEDQNRVGRQPRAVSSPDYVTCAIEQTACGSTVPTPFNPFSNDPLTAQQMAEYYGYEDLTFFSDLWQASAKIDGSLFDLPAGPVKFAVGIDWRREFMDGFLLENTINEEPNSGSYTPTERDVIAYYGEFIIPVHDMLELNAAVRQEDFDAAYGSTYDSFDPKFGFNFTPIDGLKFRGSWGTSFHAPPMRFENDDPQPLPGGNAAFTLPASYTGPCDSTLVMFNGVSGTPGLAGDTCTFTVIINSGGAGAGVLEPETATTWTLGADFEPTALPGFRASISYFNIEIEDRIQRIQSGTLPAIVSEWFATGGGGAFASALDVRSGVVDAAFDARAQSIIDSGKYLGTFGPPLANTASDTQMIVNATQLNIAALKESGIDFSVNYDFDVNDIGVGLFVYGTRLSTYELQDAPGNPFVDNLGKYSSFGAPVQWRAKGGIRLESGAVDSVFTVNYTHDYECAIGSCTVPDAGGIPVANTSPVPIDEWITFDANIGWSLDSFAGSFPKGSRLSFNVNNIFDEDPPFIDAGSTNTSTPSAYDPNNATIIGRTISMTFTKEW